GAHAAEWAITSPDLAGITLAPGGSSTVTLGCTPAAPGDASASLGLDSNLPNTPTTLTLAPSGPLPAVRLSPASAGFGARPVRVLNDAQAITLQNTGAGPLGVQSVTLAGATPGDFTITADGWTGAPLLPGQIATLNVRFTPSVAGSRSATLVVVDNA